MAKDFGTKARDYLTEKMGNPVMTSKEKNAIAELDDTGRQPDFIHSKHEKDITDGTTRVWNWKNWVKE